MHSSELQDHYKVLDIPEDAPQDEVRRAYLKLAKIYHPDKTGGDKDTEKKMREINDAYDVLKNPKKRKEYDELRRSPFGYDTGVGGGGFSTGQGFAPDGSFDDLFAGFANRGTKQDFGPRRGNDVEAGLTVSFKDIVKGVKRTIQVPITAACSACHGSGAAPDSNPVSCPDCQGTGFQLEGGGGYFVRRSCVRCGGRGTTNSKPCQTCAGNGRIRKSNRLSVQIPAGANSGMRLRMAGQGDAGEQGGPPGNLYIVVQVDDDPVFRREGINVILEAPVSFTDLALGTTVRISTLDGAADLKIPPGTPSGRVFRLAGQGLPSVDGKQKGSLLVEVAGQTPDNLSEAQKDLLRQFKATETDDNYAKPTKRANT